MSRKSIFAVAACVCGLLFENASAGSDLPAAVVRTKLAKEISIGALVERNIDILHVYPDGRVDLAVTEEQLAWVTSLGIPVSILERANLAAPAAIDENLGQYHTYAEMMAELDSLADAYPDLTKLDTLGTTLEGRVILALKISDNADTDEDEPEVLIMGCHHARELMSVDVPLLLAGHLLENYAASPSIAGLVDGREVWIAPMINPDGHYYVQLNHSGSSSYWWRKNRRPNGDGSYGVDLNRNYAYQWGHDNVGSSPTPSSAVYRGPAPFSEPETQAVRDFCIAREIVMSISYHSYGDLILYPWGYDYLCTSEQELFSVLGDSLSRGNSYLAGNSATGAIYITNGDSDDWLYGETALKGKVYAFTVELNSYEEGGFAPPESLIQPTFEEVLELNLALLRFAGSPAGVLGPRPPRMNAVAMLNDPNYELSWEEGMAGDPNPPVSYEITELENYRAAPDSIEYPDPLWVLDGFNYSPVRAKQGTYSLYSGRGDDLNVTADLASFYNVDLGMTFSAWLWYDTESGWDYAYLQASRDGGFSWINVPGNRTTSADPNGQNRGNGITGSSGGAWVLATFNLSVLGIEEGMGDVVRLRFAYITDGAVNNEGVYIDLASPVPRSDASAVIAASHPLRWFHVWPDEAGAFTYVVRAADAEGHVGSTSNVVSHTVDDLSAGTAPPAVSALGQNYPNPFNPATTITFTVGAADAGRDGAARVTLSVYDAAGRLVAPIADDRLPAGSYAAVWKGEVRGGGVAASGVYYARLVIGGRTLSRKMILVR